MHHITWCTFAHINKYKRDKLASTVLMNAMAPQKKGGAAAEGGLLDIDEKECWQRLSMSTVNLQATLNRTKATPETELQEIADQVRASGRWRRLPRPGSSRPQLTSCAGLACTVASSPSADAQQCTPPLPYP